MRYRFIPRYHEPDTGGNSTTGSAQSQQSAQLPPEAVQGFQNLLTRHQNDAIRLAETLYSENHSHRQRIGELQSQLPAQGAVVLSAEDATRWQAYTQLGDLDTLRTQLTAGTSAQEELATTRRDLLMRDVSSIAGYDREALQEIGGSWDFVIKDEQQDGKAIQTVYVKDGDQETRLDQHPKVQKFMAVLKPQQQAAPPPRGTPAGQSPRQPVQNQQPEQPRVPRVRL